MKKDYEIGYGKPPVHTRFVKGTSGNPRGRPRKEYYGHRIHRSHIKDDMERLLQQKIRATEGGRTKRITIQRAQIRGLVNRAIDGHARSIDQLWRLIKHFGVDREPDKGVIFYRPALHPFSSQTRAWLEEPAPPGPPPPWRPFPEWIAVAPGEERPPKRANVMDDLLLELQELITITERGKQKRITKQEALLRSLLAKSTSSSSAFHLFWVIVRHYELDQETDKYLQCMARREYELRLEGSKRGVEQLVAWARTRVPSD
jgi:uncharacterized protein DUF5681